MPRADRLRETQIWIILNSAVARHRRAGSLPTAVAVGWVGYEIFGGGTAVLRLALTEIFQDGASVEHLQKFIVGHGPAEIVALQ